MDLLVVESATKGNHIAEMLDNKRWKVIASSGHIRNLPDKEMGVEPPDYKPKYVLSDKGERAIREIAQFVLNGFNLWLATDPDREGEAISAHILEEVEKIVGKKVPYQRVTFNSIVQSVILKAISEPRQIDWNLVFAQEARRVIDRRVGYLTTPVLNNAVGRHLSAGRVQSVAVRLVDERVRQIKSHKAREHFSVTHRFSTASSGEWESSWNFSNLLPEGSELWMDKEQARIISQINEFTVLDTKLTQHHISPAGAFTTSSFQQAATVQLGMRPDEAMEIAQRLFEGCTSKDGYITYHRTDNANLSQDTFDRLLQSAGANGIPKKELLVKTRREFANRKGAQEGHEAISPASWDRDISLLSEEEKAVYLLIKNRSITSQMVDAVYSGVVVNLSARHPHSDMTLNFKSKGSLLEFAGWKSFQSEDVTIDADDIDDSAKLELNNPVPKDLEAGSKIKSIGSNVGVHKTHAAKRFTLGSLVQELEHRGIGRPATYASILKNILRRGYIYEEGKYLTTSEDGQVLVAALVNSKINFIDYEFTANTEEKFDEIANGRCRYIDLVVEIDNQLNKVLKHFDVGDIKVERHVCSKCVLAGQKNHLIRGRNKETLRYYWSCKEGHMNDDAGGRPAPIKYESFPCPISSCNKMTVQRRRGSDGFFFSCSSCNNSFGYDNGKPILSFKQSEPSKDHECLACGKMAFVRLEGKFGFYWRCKECNISAKDKNGVPYIPPPSIKKEIPCPHCQNSSDMTQKKGQYGLYWRCGMCNKNSKDKNGVPAA
ncbi:DNA topoisomerase [Iodobacter sp. CM08]|uniref:type IA DNA topoisomerase n=1 Tax=Iodobacter sp. CM08 TaxID=3085902 RepID=UPI0029819D1D|nr:DNA topoisomerase [Iodobacter sp. CM08]MDW5418767.1 DNA topoisomerase [Iodobacter sp. CM08]